MAEVEREAALLASAGRAERDGFGAAPAAVVARALRRCRPAPWPRSPARRCWSASVRGRCCSAAATAGGRSRSRPTPSLQRASAELELNGDRGILVANGLPAPAERAVYQVWLQRPGHSPEPTSALFTPRRDGSATASVTGDLEGVQTVIVNTEPLGGSTTPTSDPLLTATLS